MLTLLPHFGRGPTVSESAGSITPTEVVSRLSGPWNSTEAVELHALSRETDPALFQEGLLHFAGRLERRGSSGASQAVLETLLEVAEGSVAVRARSRLEALRGLGSVGARAEVLLGRFAAEATEPATLFAMAGAGTVYRFSRFALLSRLGAAPAHFWTRGFGGRALASSLAFSVEAASFPLLARGGHAALGRSQEWSAGALGREIASSFCVLGGLKLVGAGGAYLRSRLSSGSAWLGPVFQQGAMLSGILAGHRLEEAVGLRPGQDGATTLIDSLALLLQFNVAGRLSRNLFGAGFRRWELELDRRSQDLLPRPRWNGPGLSSGIAPAPAYAMTAIGPEAPRGIDILMMENAGRVQGGATIAPASLRLPKMGLRSGGHAASHAERLNREEAERWLREWIPGGVFSAQLQSPGFVENLLQAFGVTAHAFDVQAFRQGYEIAQRHPGRVARLAFDFDEVYLHWAFGPRDLVRVMARGAEAAYYHTPRSALEYETVAAAEGRGLSRADRLWFEGVQRLFPLAFRQHLQFHPGVRAFQLGLRLGQHQNLMMVTVGPAGRLMTLANEDPALKMIYFGRMPLDEITIEDLRQSTNIYTREDIALALRELGQEGSLFPGNAQVESYLETLRRFPEDGHRIKHPALALLRGKRPFDALVDDSSFAPRALGELPGFRIFQVPSARPARTLNFTPGGVKAYLARSANGYVEALAARLLGDWSAGPVENLPPPPDYLYQRLALQIPWTKFGADYVALGKEARAWGRDLAEGKVRPQPLSTDPAKVREPLSLSEDQTRILTERLYREFDILLDGRPGEVSIETHNTLTLREMAVASPEDFQATLDTYFTAEEQALLPQLSRPLAARGGKFYSRIASLIAGKTAVCNLLALDVAEHALEIRFRYGRPLLEGTAARRLNGGSLLTTLSDDGEIGLGIALIEPNSWDSGLVGIGVDLTTDRVNYTQPRLHTLASAAFKATYPAHRVRRFNHYRARELVTDEWGNPSLTGFSMQAARHLRGDQGTLAPLPVRSLDFRVGRATVALVAIPALRSGPPRPGFQSRPPNFPYRIDSDGRYQLPRPGMTVAVLGDVNAPRTMELVRKGHYVVHIERDPDMAELATRMVERFLRDEGPSIGQASDNSVMQADWYSSGTNADRVEAYFPLSGNDVPRRGEPGRMEVLQEFLEEALNSKLVNGGSGFVISEVRPHIEDLADLIRADPQLELLEATYEIANPPLVGGFGAMPGGMKRGHYLIYRKIGTPSR